MVSGVRRGKFDFLPLSCPFPLCILQSPPLSGPSASARSPPPGLPRRGASSASGRGLACCPWLGACLALTTSSGCCHTVSGAPGTQPAGFSSLPVPAPHPVPRSLLERLSDRSARPHWGRAIRRRTRGQHTLNLGLTFPTSTSSCFVDLEFFYKYFSLSNIRPQQRPTCWQ